METDTLSRPRKVVFAFYLILIAFFIGLINAIIKYVTTDVLSRGLSAPFGRIAMAVGAVVFVLYIINIYFMFKRRDWARIVYQVVNVVGFLYLVVKLIIKHTFPTDIVFLTEVVLNLTALVLLYSSQANDWYNAKTAVQDL